MKRYLIIAIIALVGIAWIQQQRIERVKDENNRLSNNQYTLLESADYYRTKDSLSVASVQSLTLKRDEIEAHYSDLTAVCDDLRIKVKRLQSATTTVSSTEIDVTAPIRDTIIVVKEKPITMQSFRWSDAWTNIEGLILEKEVACRVRSIDTLRQVVHRIPKRFLFFRYGTKAIRQEILSSNPHNTIIYSEYIELKK